MTTHFTLNRGQMPTLAAVAVTVAALGAVFTATSSDAQSAGNQGYATPAVVAPAYQANGTPALIQPRQHNSARSHATAGCANCGVVESVVAVQRQGEPKHIGGTAITPGTIAGGVIGGIIGNQVGNGRTGATVLGAAGGAYVGNRIEKKIVKYTAYQMHIRMSDGSMRTIEQRSALAAGSHVVVEGRAVRLAGINGSRT